MLSLDRWADRTLAAKKAGRSIFTSYPANNISDYAATGAGAHTGYDALGRVTEVDQDSELGTLKTTTAYLSGFQTQTTDPRGNSTLTSYQAYGAPTTKFPDSVTAPNGELTVILRDAFDKPLSITRTGTAQGSLQLTRYYVYDSHQQLCKRVDPESGATAFGYDAAGNLAWSAAGLTSLTGSTTCDASAALASGRVVNRTYDALNRVTALTFPDGNGNQAWTYTPDGQPSTITRQNDNGGVTNVLVTNSYLYDQRGLLISEALTQNGSTWTMGYGHDANGHLAGETYPNGLTIPFAPNALGQPTQVGSYATGVSYYPDGKVSQFTYGNGIVHTLTENAREERGQVHLFGCVGAARGRWAGRTLANRRVLVSTIARKSSRPNARCCCRYVRTAASSSSETAALRRSRYTAAHASRVSLSAE